MPSPISSDIEYVASLLRDERIVAIPTETVYGLAGNIFSEKAIRTIFETKKRPMFNPLIVHLSGVEQVKTVAKEFPEAAQKLARAFWPGPLTLILPKKDIVPDLITGGKPTVALRVPDHPTTLALLRQLPFPLAAPSANPFGSISPTMAEHVANYFGHEVKVLQGGPCENGIESTIVGFEEGQPILYRLGAIPQEDLEGVVGPIPVKNKKDDAPEAPGMLSRHYAPETTTYLVPDVLEFLEASPSLKVGVLTFQKAVKHPSIEKALTLSPAGDLKEAAAKLYDAMHHLDTLDLDIIVAERFPEENLGASINDRLERATKKA